MQVAGQIHYFARDFCNLKVRKNKQKCAVFSHNLFGFHFYFVVKGVRLSIWGIKDFSIAGKTLSSINIPILFIK